MPSRSKRVVLFLLLALLVVTLMLIAQFGFSSLVYNVFVFVAGFVWTLTRPGDIKYAAAVVFMLGVLILLGLPAFGIISQVAIIFFFPAVALFQCGKRYGPSLRRFLY